MTGTTTLTIGGIGVCCISTRRVERISDAQFLSVEICQCYLQIFALKHVPEGAQITVDAVFVGVIMYVRLSILLLAVAVITPWAVVIEDKYLPALVRMSVGIPG